MNDLITKAAPLLLALLLGLVGVVSTVVSHGRKLTAEDDLTKREKLATAILLAGLPPSLCLSAFSYDIWALTTLFAGDEKTWVQYNIKGKDSAVLVLLLVH